MLGKLSFRNAKRQALNYIIYFITVTISIGLIFSFNFLAFSKDVNELSQQMKYFKQVIIILSIIIAISISWLINYTMKFMLEKRSKEFAIYQILGIEKRDISSMFVKENIIIGIIALISGILFGILLYQVLISMVMNIFKQPYQINMDFSYKALLLTILYFILIYGIIILKHRKKIKNSNVYELLYSEKQNENHIIKKVKYNKIIFVISIILLLISVLIVKYTFSFGSNVSFKLVLIALISLIVGIYLFYISICGFILDFYINNKKRKYKKNNIFLYRNLISKVNTMSITMATLAVMFVIIIIGLNISMLMNNMLNNEMEILYPFEIMISTTDGDFTKYKEYIKKNSDVVNMHEYKIYTIEQTPLIEALKDTSLRDRKYNKVDNVIKLSDYNKLREMIGYSSVELSNDEIIVNTISTASNYINKYIKENGNYITACNKKYKIRQVEDINLGQLGFNGFVYFFVVNDNEIEFIKENEISSDYLSNNLEYKLVVNTKEKTTQAFYDDLCSYIKTYHFPQVGIYDGIEKEYDVEISLGNVLSRGQRIGETKSFYTIISFSAIYVSLILIMISATLLAIQQLSESEKYKYRYKVLKDLGMDEMDMNKIIFKQIFIYFLLPILIPVLISVPIVLSIGNIFTLAVTYKEIIKNICFVFGIFFLVYSIYFVATDVQFEKNINEEW